jgi:hypothetical protein
LGSTALRAAPGSAHVVATVSRRTQFDNPTSLAVVDVRDGWAEVISTSLATAGTATSGSRTCA